MNLTLLLLSRWNEYEFLFSTRALRPPLALRSMRTTPQQTTTPYIQQASSTEALAVTIQRRCTNAAKYAAFIVITFS